MNFQKIPRFRLFFFSYLLCLLLVSFSSSADAIIVNDDSINNGAPVDNGDGTWTYHYMTTTADVELIGLHFNFSADSNGNSDDGGFNFTDNLTDPINGGVTVTGLWFSSVGFNSNDLEFTTFINDVAFVGDVFSFTSILAPTIVEWSAYDDDPNDSFSLIQIGAGTVLGPGLPVPDVASTGFSPHLPSSCCLCLNADYRYAGC